MIKILLSILSKKYKSIGDLISSRKLGNIVVISKNGEIVGKVGAVRMKGFSVEGIVIFKFFGLGSIFIDRSFIKVFNQNEVLLNINPVTSLKGRQVYDVSGRKLGKVRKILRKDNDNNFTSIVVKDRFYKKPILIGKDKIDIMKKNIVLNIDYMDYIGTNKKKK